jgi:hypothetical protein
MQHPIYFWNIQILYYLYPEKNATMGCVRTKNVSHLTKFLVKNNHIYDFKLIYYET